MWRVLFLLVSLLGIADEEPRLLPGERLEDVTSARLELSESGSYTLARSNGALVLGEQRSDTGWLVVELPAGTHRVELPDGPGDVTALVGAVEEATAAGFVNAAIRQLDDSEFEAARFSLLASQGRPGQAAPHAAARALMGVLFQRQGVRLDEARELLLGAREEITVFGAQLGAIADNSIAQVAMELGEWDDATAAYTRIREAAEDPSLRALALSGLAQAAAGSGEHELARRHHEQALAALDAGESLDAIIVSSVCFEAARWYEERAEFARAAELFTRAADSAPTWHQQVNALGQLGLVELVRGRHGAALGLMDRAAELAAPHSPSPYDTALLQNRAALAYALGEFGVAQRTLTELTARETDPETRARLLANQALVAYMQNDAEASKELYEQALSTAPEVGQARWLALVGQAVLLLRDEQAERALPLMLELLELAERLDEPFLSAVSRLGVAEAHRLSGDADASRAAAEAGLAALEAQDARDMLLPALLGVASAALAQGDEGTVAALLERAWDESASEQLTSLSSIEGAQVRSRLSDQLDWGAVATDLLARRAARGEAPTLSDLHGLARWKARSLHETARPQAPDFGELEAALQGRTLVEYSVGEERLYAFVHRRGASSWVDLGERRPVETLVASFLQGLTDAYALAPPAQVALLGTQLHERLLAPLGELGDRLVIVPGGELARLPFEALVASAPAEVTRFDQLEFVIDGIDVGYAPSSTALVTLDQRPQPNRAGRVVLLGDPTYQSESAPRLLAARGDAARRWERLPKSRDELARVARLLLSARDDERAPGELFELAGLEDERDVNLANESFELRLGSEASWQALETLAPSARLIHIASHARVDRWDARRSGLVLAWDDATQGLFSLADIAALQLDAELVVLSACGTADGRLLNGEGVQSVASAFLDAGARGVVATLWPVQDVQARDLMESFAAEYLSRGVAPDRALRSAKRELRRGTGSRGAALSERRADARLGHPHYWAAFLFSGVSGPATR